jgi:hypothetical protein
MLCWSVLLRSLLVYGLITHHVRADDCGRYRYGLVRCGEECGDSCVCGAGGQKFDFKRDVWCCDADKCEMDEWSGGISCANGTTLPLTKPCEGECNDYSAGSYFARHYKSCYSRTQCVMTSQWTYNKIECWDRSDEEEDRSGAPPNDWQVKECGNSYYPGLTCDGTRGDSLGYSSWCNDKIVASCSHLGGLTSLHQEVCRNDTYWHPKTCRDGFKDGVRCSSAWSDSVTTRTQKRLVP